MMISGAFSPSADSAEAALAEWKCYKTGREIIKLRPRLGCVLIVRHFWA